MQSIAMKQSSMGIKHRDHSTTGSTLKPTTNSAVTIYFFGKHLNKSMTVDRFHEFQEQLNREILLLEVCNVLKKGIFNMFNIRF